MSRRPFCLTMRFCAGFLNFFSFKRIFLILIWFFIRCISLHYLFHFCFFFDIYSLGIIKIVIIINMENLYLYTLTFWYVICMIYLEEMIYFCCLSEWVYIFILYIFMWFKMITQNYFLINVLSVNNLNICISLLLNLNFILWGMRIIFIWEIIYYGFAWNRLCVNIYTFIFVFATI